MNAIGPAAFAAQDPTKLVPHGDRLLVREIEVEDAAMVGGKKWIIATMPTKDNPEGDVQVKRGWKLVQVVAVGNGHRLEVDATVPMPFAPGDVGYIERLTGRELVLQGQKYLVINQVDWLLHAPQAKALLDEPALAVAAS